MKVYTKTGDTGTTSLLRTRVPKDIRIEKLGP
jgi:cob(I)alamin adenosyltransferase